VDAHARRRKGWSISTTADDHPGGDRRTIQAWLTGERTVCRRAPAGPAADGPFVEYWESLRRPTGSAA